MDRGRIGIEDENMLDEEDRKNFKSLVATLNYMSRCATCREGDMHEDGESDPRELEETGEGSQMSERSTTSDWAKGPEKKSTSGHKRRVR